MAQKPRRTSAVEKKLVGVADVVITAAQRRKDPTLAIPVRSLSNVTFNQRNGLIEMGKRKQARSFFNVGMAKKFMQTVLVADALCELQRANLTTSLREIYYRTKHTIKNSHENTLDTQDESDPLIEDLEVTLAALREELHVRAENAGSVVGPLVLVDDGDRVDCAKLGKGGYSVPSIVEPEYLQITRCTADFVLLVEKGTQWNRLSEDKFWRTYNCILLTGNGQPPRGVRRLARRLHEERRLPVYVLVDNDPWGYYIYSVIKQGSINLAWPFRRPSSSGSRAEIPNPTGCPATWASSSTTRTSPAPASSSRIRGSRRRAGRRRSSGCSRAGSNTSWTPSPTRTSSTSPRSISPASSKRRIGWIRPSARLTLRRSERDLSQSTYFDRVGSEPSAHRHPARQGGVELDPDRRNGHGCRVRPRRVEEFQGDNGENRPAVFNRSGSGSRSHVWFGNAVFIAF